MKFPISIEVAVTEGVSSTERGRILERFSKRLLQTQNYTVTEEVRLTGVEVDLYAQENTTGEVVFVECKAHRAPLSAEVIVKLKGQVSFKSVTSGWLISTGEFSKDAKGLMADWNGWPPAKKRELQLYDPAALVQRLILANIIIDPASIPLPHGGRCLGALLILTQMGEFWVLSEKRAAQLRMHLFDATNGSAVTCSQTLQHLKSTDTTAAKSLWQPGPLETQTTDHDKNQEENYTDTRQQYIATFALLNKRPEQRSVRSYFFGRGRPEDAASLLTEIRNGKLWDSSRRSGQSKNAYSDLRKLGLLVTGGELALERGEGNKTSADIIKCRAIKTEFVIAAANFLAEFPDAPAIDIGEIIQQQFSFEWHSKTRAAIGRRLRQWVRWCNPEIDKLVTSAAPDMNVLFSKLRNHDRRRRSVWTKEEWDIAVELAQNGKSALDISRKIKVGRTNIQNHLESLRAGKPFNFRVTPPSDDRMKQKQK